MHDNHNIYINTKTCETKRQPRLNNNLLSLVECMH